MFDKMPDDLKDLYRRNPGMTIAEDDNLEATDPNYDIVGGRQRMKPLMMRLKN